MIKVKFNYLKFCIGNCRDYWRKPVVMIYEFDTKEEANKWIKRANERNTHRNDDHFTDIELIEER